MDDIKLLSKFSQIEFVTAILPGMEMYDSLAEKTRDAEYLGIESQDEFTFRLYGLEDDKYVLEMSKRPEEIGGEAEISYFLVKGQRA